MITVTTESTPRKPWTPRLWVVLSSGERYVLRRAASLWPPILGSHDLGFRLLDGPVEMMSARKQRLSREQVHRGLSRRYLYRYGGVPIFALNRLSAFSELGDFIEYRGCEYALSCGHALKLGTLGVEATSLALWAGPSPVVTCHDAEHLPLAIGLTCYIVLRQWLGEP